MTVARSWTILANQMDRLEAILGQENKSEFNIERQVSRKRAAG